MFPKIGVYRRSSILIRFSIINHPFSIFWKYPYRIKNTPRFWSPNEDWSHHCSHLASPRSRLASCKRCLFFSAPPFRPSPTKQVSFFLANQKKMVHVFSWRCFHKYIYIQYIYISIKKSEEFFCSRTKKSGSRSWCQKRSFFFVWAPEGEFFHLRLVVAGTPPSIPRCSMYGIFSYIWPKFMVNVGKYTIYTIHWASGII